MRFRIEEKCSLGLFAIQHYVTLNVESMSILTPKIEAFVRGYARTFDLFGSIPSFSYESSDSQALCKDWEAVGADLKAAIQKYEQEKITATSSASTICQC